MVCPENCGSRIFIDRTYAILCHTSSGVSLIFFGIRFLNSQNSLRASVSPDLRPLTCVPPPTVGIRFTKLSAVVLLVFSVQVSAQLSSSSLFFNAITKGTDAQAEVSVRLKENDISVSGTASDTDTMVASANAYIIALNKLIMKRKKRNIDLNLSTKKIN